MSAADPAPTYLTFGAMLEALNYDGSDLLQCSHIEPGKHLSPVNPRLVSWYWDNDSVPWSDGDWYFGLCPINPSMPVAKRQTADHAHAMRVLVADLDHKPGGCVDAAGSAIVTNLIAAALYTRPTVIVSTGHGIAPYWPADPDDPDWADLSTTDITALYRRFGRLVAKLASIAGYHVDNIFDAARVMRIPGTMNWKDPDHLVECTATLDTGAPITLAALLGALDEYGIDEVPSDRDLSSLGNDVLAAPSSWPSGLPEPCPYVVAMTAQWRTERADRVKGERNTTLFLRAMRLAAARRRGCLSDATLAPLWAEVGATFLKSLEHGNVRAPRRGEIEATWANAVNRVARMTDEQLGKEIGHHLHPGDPDPLTGTVGTPGTSSSSAGAGSPIASGPVSTDSTAPAVLPVGANRPAAWLPENLADYEITRWVVETKVLEDWRWAKGMGWVHWTGSIWVEGEDDKTIASTVIAAAIRIAYAAEIASGMANKQRAAALAGLLDHRNLIAVAVQSSRQPEVRVEAGDFDAKPMLVPFTNGVYDALAKQFRPHDKTDMFTRHMSTHYDPTARNDDWDTVVKGDTAVLPSDIMDWLQERLGMTLIGQRPADIHHLYLRGGGKNAKSTMVLPIRAVFGSLGSNPNRRIVYENRSVHDTEKMVLRGARFSIIEELHDNEPISTSALKDLAQSVQNGRRAGSPDNIEWATTHSLILTSNKELRIKDTDTGSWRRVWRVEYPYKYKVTGTVDPDKGERRGIAGLDDRLERNTTGTEWPAIAAWLVEGMEKALKRGHVLATPEAVEIATREWRGKVDDKIAFIEGWLVADPTGFIHGNHMHQAIVRTSGNKTGIEGPTRMKNLLAEHPLFKDNGVTYGKYRVGGGELVVSPFPAALSNLMNASDPELAVPPGNRPRGWRGVRFRTAADGEGFLGGVNQ